MNAHEIRLALLSQHERLRAQVQTCTRLAKLFREGHHTGRELDDALALLREEFSAHNQAESTVIRRLLQGTTTVEALLVDRMLEEHVAEHAAFWELLAGTHAEAAARIDDLADELDAHMAAEERTFLAPMTLRGQP